MSEKWNETHGNQKIAQRSDQLFVSNFLGTDALSAVSIAGPFLSIALAIGTMIATGGCALVSGRMGEGQMEKARQNFSFFMLFSVAISTLFCVLGILFRRPILYAMGADEALYHLCEAYAVPIFLLIPFAMVSIVLQIFFVAAGRPGLGFGLSIAGGVTNTVGRSVRHFGAENFSELKHFTRAALKTVAGMSLLTFAIAFPLARPIALLFAENSAPVTEMAVRGTYIFAAAFLLMGFNLFASGFFTALNDGKTSAILSLFRTLISLILPLLILPRLWGVDGVWISMPVAEVLSILLSVFYFRRMRNKYHYA